MFFYWLKKVLSIFKYPDSETYGHLLFYLVNVLLLSYINNYAIYWTTGICKTEMAPLLNLCIKSLQKSLYLRWTPTILWNLSCFPIYLVFFNNASLNCHELTWVLMFLPRERGKEEEVHGKKKKEREKYNLSNCKDLENFITGFLGADVDWISGKCKYMRRKKTYLQSNLRN